jgi:protein LSM14
MKRLLIKFNSEPRRSHFHEERKLNLETFGQATVDQSRYRNNYRGGRGGYRGGNRGGYYRNNNNNNNRNNNNGYNNNNNGYRQHKVNIYIFT